MDEEGELTMFISQGTAISLQDFLEGHEFNGYSFSFVAVNYSCHRNIDVCGLGEIHHGILLRI